jgi:hypothetical protein
VLLCACGTADAATEPLEPLVPGYRLVEGDILVPDRPGSDATWSTACDLWPEGLVYFEFDDNVVTDNRNRMREAMDEVIGVCGVVFLPRLDEENYVHIYLSTANASPVGMEGGEQGLYIHNFDVRFIMVHELLHTLGFWHEQSRPDRDTYIEVIEENIEPGFEHNFQIEIESGIVGGYDFESLMHYGECYFSVCGGTCGTILCALQPHQGRTIVMRPGYEQWQDVIGQREYLSDADIAGLRHLYGNGEVVYVDHTYPETGEGTLRRPFHHLTSGIAAVATGGTVWIRGGDYTAGGSHARAMRWRTYYGSTSIGN